MLFRQLFDHESSTYSYLLADQETREALLIDPVREQVERDLKLISELELKLLYVLETHVHADHVTGAGAIRDWTGAKTGVCAKSQVPCVDLCLAEGQELRFGRHQLRVLETPGHTDGCLSFVVDGQMVFTGDALLIRGTGRTDFQSGDAGTLYRSITGKLFPLGDQVLVYPAHDYRGLSVSTIAEERRFNPRLAGKSEAEFIEIMGQLKLAQPKKIHEALPGNMACGRPSEWSALPLGQDQVQVQWTYQQKPKLQLLDVREDDEYADCHIHGSIQIPLAQLSQRLAELNSAKPTVVLCLSGVRSNKALKLLRAKGFDKSWNLEGGMKQWLKEQLPVVRGTNR